MNTQNQADLIIEARWIIPVAPPNTVLEHHSVVINAGIINEILPTAEAHSRGLSAKRTHTLTEHVLIPGLVNAHTHAATSLLRGIADDRPLTHSSREISAPKEGRHLTADFVRDGSLLAAAEMLLGGITCANDMYHFPGSTADAFAEAGLRAVIGIMVTDLPSNYASDADDYLRKGLYTRDEWKQHPLIQFSLAPYAPHSVCDSALERIATLADELDCPIHTHLHETQAEIAESESKHGVRPLLRLAKFGLLGPNLSVAHGVHLAPNELDTLALHGISVIHSPTSNMKLGAGASPVTEMLAHGINVGLGSDGAASNRLDIFHEMLQAALLANLRESDAYALPAHELIRMATIGGARALGLDKQIGTIENGKYADLCAISLSSPFSSPCLDPTPQLVYTAGRESVSHVWVAGEERVSGGKLLHLHNSDLLRSSRIWQNVLQG